MQLLDNWKEILQQAWSVRFAAVSSLFASLQQAMACIPIDLLTAEQSAAIAGVFGSLGGLFAALVVVARVFDQGLAK